MTNTIDRNQFGKGKLGKKAFSIINFGATCELIDDHNNRICKKPAISTIDFDVIGEAEMVAVCSEEHEQLIKKRIEDDLKKAGRQVSFGTNGFGRP